MTCNECGSTLSTNDTVVFCERCLFRDEAMAGKGMRNAEQMVKTLILRASLGAMKEPICERV